MTRIKRMIDQALCAERLKTLEQIEAAITDVESGQASALDSLYTLHDTASDEMFGLAEKLGMVTSTRSNESGVTPGSGACIGNAGGSQAIN